MSPLTICDVDWEQYRRVDVYSHYFDLCHAAHVGLGDTHCATCPFLFIPLLSYPNLLIFPFSCTNSFLQHHALQPSLWRTSKYRSWNVPCTMELKSADVKARRDHNVLTFSITVMKFVLTGNPSLNQSPL